LKTVLIIVLVSLIALVIIFNVGRPRFIDLDGRNLGELAQLKDGEDESSNDNGGSCDYKNPEIGDAQCSDGNDCTKDKCEKAPNEDKGSCDYSNEPVGKQCDPPGSATDGFCENGVCIEKTCASVYGPGYIQCRKAGDMGGNEKCCGPGEKCCPGDLEDEDANPVCCSAKETDILKDDYEDCDSYTTEIDGQDVKFNYCDVEVCEDPTPQKCVATWVAVCCKAKPEEYCGVQEAPINIPFCAQKIDDDDTCDEGTFECFRASTLGDDEVLCCITGEETCETVPYSKTRSYPNGIKFCNSQKCDFGDPCQGKDLGVGSNNAWRKICCNEDETCYHQPNGYPKCVKI